MRLVFVILLIVDLAITTTTKTPVADAGTLTTAATLATVF